MKLDLSWFDERSPPYGLSAFDVHEAFATKEEVSELKGASKRGISRITFRIAQKIRPYYRRSVFAEPHLRPYDPNIERTPTNLYLEGYWQSERYFLAIQEIIKREFTIKCEPDDENKQLAEKIIQTNSVSVHFRRRHDYPHIHPSCDLGYYDRSRDFITTRLPDPHFYVFSDDMVWAKENVRYQPETTYVTHNGSERNYEDLRLMSLCKHNVIANSSFSWWAAWLNPDPNKIVLAPSQWFSDPTLDTRDLLPPGWIRL